MGRKLKEVDVRKPRAQRKLDGRGKHMSDRQRRMGDREMIQTSLLQAAS